MRLGLNLGYWGAGRDHTELELAVAADRLGCSVVWAAEAYGSDAATVLAWVAARTARIDVGSAVLQIPARSPATTAMTAATLDALSAGRFRLGLGVSGPQVSEGWHGVRFDDPVGRTREYVEIVRMALRRERVAYAGRHHRLPLPDSAGKPLVLTVRPQREIPLYLAALGPRNLDLTGEIADGWLGMFVSPDHLGGQLGHLEAGRRRAGRDGLAGFDVVATVPLHVGPDAAACAGPVREHLALYVGGMGSRDRNFYRDLVGRYGYAGAAATVRDHYLAGDRAAAAAAVPFELADAVSLLGPRERLAERMKAFAAAGVTTLAVQPCAATLPERLAELQVAVEAFELAGVVP